MLPLIVYDRRPGQTESADAVCAQADCTCACHCSADSAATMSNIDLLSNQYKLNDADPSVSSGTTSMDSGERKLAALGYTQQLNRGFSTFTNFAVSFSIISILTGVTGGLHL